MLFYRAALPLSRQTLIFVSGLVRAHRREIGTPWRALNPGQQAMLVLVHLRKGEPFAEVGTGFDVSTTTCWRYVNETVELLAARAPKLREALRKAKREKMAYVIIDGTLIPNDRIAADRPFFSGKHKRHGVNLQVIASPDGRSCGSPASCRAAHTTPPPPASGRSWPHSNRPGSSPWATRATTATTRPDNE